MQNILVEKYGFKKEDILMINEDQDSQALADAGSRGGIIKKLCLTEWLYQGAKPGDLLFFHYSGHGSQYQGDKKTMPSDVICPLDCIGGEWPQTVITDAEIHQKLYDPLPKGCKAVCLFDCCHSATVANLAETMVVQSGPLTAEKKVSGPVGSGSWQVIDENHGNYIPGELPPRSEAVKRWAETREKVRKSQTGQELLMKKLQVQKEQAETQVRFYQEVNSGKLDLKKKSTTDLVALFEKHGFPKKTGPSDDGSGYWYLLSKEIKAFCTGSVQKAEKLLAERVEAMKKLEATKVGEGAQIYIGNLEQDLEVRIRYFPQPAMEQTEEKRVKPVNHGLKGALRNEKYQESARAEEAQTNDHELWVFSGCQDDQTSADAHVEGIYQGAFTWALIKALKVRGWEDGGGRHSDLKKGNLEIGRYDQVPALSTTREEYLDFGFCGKLKEDGCVIEG
ncbi:Metacaspase-1 [Durusdinium trenchii]|uniref:Metacaspase-1 n=1 Tax=Durusdinium trenchii TaxID=1381693 RepID=A0ABP0M3C1_9DINO